MGCRLLRDVKQRNGLSAHPVQVSRGCLFASAHSLAVQPSPLACCSLCLPGLNDLFSNKWLGVFGEACTFLVLGNIHDSFCLTKWSGTYIQGFLKSKRIKRPVVIWRRLSPKFSEFCIFNYTYLPLSSSSLTHTLKAIAGQEFTEVGPDTGVLKTQPLRSGQRDHHTPGSFCACRFIICLFLCLLLALEFLLSSLLDFLHPISLMCPSYLAISNYPDAIISCLVSKLLWKVHSVLGTMLSARDTERNKLEFVLFSRNFQSTRYLGKRL